MISRLVKGDRMTIGVLKSMGYTNMQVLIHYSKFAVFIGLLGSLLGVLLGTIVSKYFTQLYLMFYKVHYVTIEYYIGYLVGGILLSVIFSIGAGVIGAKGTLKIVPAESMRKEPPKSGKRIIFEDTKIWKKLNFTQKMVWRNLLRDKKRVIFVAFGVSITLLVVFVPLYLFANMPELFDNQFGQLQQMDYNIEFSRPTSIRSLDVIEDQVDYDLMEGKLEYPFEIESKWKSQIVSLIGLEKDTGMYNFEDKNEKPLVPEKNFVYVSEGLAKVLEIAVGDRIKINNYIPGKDDIYVKVTGINKQNLGTNVYMDIDLMREGLVEKNSINGVFLNTKDDVKENLEKIRYISGINSIDDMSSSFEEFMQITAASISSLLFFGFILGFAIMYNTTVMTINSRLLEFSSLRILGMSKGEIIGVILKENFVITVIGILIGTPLSSMASQGITDAFSTDLYTFGGSIKLSTFIYGIGITLIFILISQLAAYHKIRKLNFIEALKERTT
jgi:putative ABC transport system permease protein